MSTQASYIGQNFVESGTLFRQLFLKKTQETPNSEKNQYSKNVRFYKENVFPATSWGISNIYQMQIIFETSLKIGTRLQNLDVFHKLQMYLCLFLTEAKSECVFIRKN